MMSSLAADRAVIVYRAVNVVNGHSYIGFTTQGLSRRVQNHRRVAGVGGGWKLHAAMRKYGVDSIKFETIFDFGGDEELAKAYEIEAIAKYRPEYNLSHGGDGGTVHPDTAKKISAANKGRPSVFKGKKFTPEALEKFRETKVRNGKPHGRLGKTFSVETREKMSASHRGVPSAMKGKTYPPEVHARMKEAAQKRKPRSYTAEDKARWAAITAKRKGAVRCLNDGQVFESATAADRHYGLRRGSVTKTISGGRKKTHGLSFARYEGE